MPKITEEVFFKKDIHKTLKEPFSTAFEIEKIASTFGVLEEKENKIYSSESGGILRLSFDVNKNIDNVSSIVFSIEIKSESDSLYMSIKGFLKTRLLDNEKLFNEFYTNEMQPKIISYAKNEIKDFSKKIENVIKKRSYAKKFSIYFSGSVVI